MNQSKLLLWPALRMTESARGYMLRAADMNLLPRMFREDLKSIEGLMRFISHAQETNHIVAAHLRTRFTQTDIYSRRGIRMMRLGSDTIPDRLLLTTARQVCPACLAGRSHNRLEWELRSVKACAVHGCRLIRHCPSCEEPIRWYSSSVLNCICGQDLRAIGTHRAMEWQVTWSKLVRKAAYASLAPPLQPSSRLGLNPPEGRSVRYIPLHLSKLLLIADVVQFVLLPAHIGLFPPRELEMLIPTILSNRAYCAYLWDAVFLFAAADPFDLTEMLTPGQSPDCVFYSFRKIARSLALSDVLRRPLLNRSVAKSAMKSVIFDVRRHGVPPHAYLTGGWDEDDWTDEDDLNQQLPQEVHT